MSVIANVFVVLVALLHAFISWCWRCFLDQAARTENLRQHAAEGAGDGGARRQSGLYNGFLVAGLVWGLVHPTPAIGFQIKVFFLLCVIVAGLYGGYSVKPKIIYVQAAPALIALILVWLA